MLANEIPAGRVPVTLSVGRGLPLAVTANDRPWPTCTDVDDAVVVMAGAADPVPMPMVMVGVMSGSPPLVLAAWTWKL